MKKTLGIDPVTATIIVNLIITGVQYGLSAYSAAQQAKAQAKLQRDLEETELSKIAETLSQKTGLSFTQWYTVCKMTFNLPGDPTIPPPDVIPKKDNKILYIAAAIVGLLIISRR